MSISINIWAVLVCAGIHWVVGALWYSPLMFAKPWAKAKGIDTSSPEHGASALMYASGLLVGLILAFGLSVVLDLSNITTVPMALVIAAIAWIAFNAAPNMSNAVFGGSFVLWIIDSTYPLVTALIMGTILTVWQ